MGRSARKEVTALVKGLRRQGWMCTKDGARWRLQAPSGNVVVCSASPRDDNALRNIRADVRKAR